jgi:hypothetical protein
MTARIRWTILAALLIAMGAALPAPAAANTSCTDGYQWCLNDSYDKTGFYEYLANLECGVRFARCIKDAFYA